MANNHNDNDMKYKYFSEQLWNDLQNGFGAEFIHKYFKVS